MTSRKFHVFAAIVIASVIVLASLLVQTERFNVITADSNSGPPPASSPLTIPAPIINTTWMTSMIILTQTQQPRKRLRSDLKPFPEYSVIDSSENEIDGHVTAKAVEVLTTAKTSLIEPQPKKVNFAKTMKYFGQNIMLPSSAVDFIYHMINTHLRRDSEEEIKLEESSSLMASQPRVHHLLIFSYFRGGTTFFSELLSELPAAFLHFEPLHFVSLNDQVEHLNLTEAALNMVRDLLNCRFDDNYIRYASQPPNDFLLSRHKRLWNFCRMHSPLCSDAGFWNESCKLYAKHDIHLNIMKLVRLRLRYAKTFLDEFEDLQVIHLVRDPRALYASRRKLPWCSQTQSCIDPNVFCPYAMQDDVDAAQQLRTSYKDRFLELKHEDVASDPRAATIKVMQFLKRPTDPLPLRVDRFLSTHTKAAPTIYQKTNSRVARIYPWQTKDNARFHRGYAVFPYIKQDVNNVDPYSTKRDSQSTIDKWRKSLMPSEILKLEEICYPVLQYYNYELVN